MNSQFENSQKIERALRYMRLHQTHPAINALTEVLSDDSEHATAHALLSMCLRNEHRLHAAKFEAHQALLYGPENPLSHIACGLACFAGREFTSAEDHYRQALVLDPDSSWAMLELSNLYLAWGKTEQATKMIDQVCAIAPNDADSWSIRARLDFDQGNFIAAEKHARHALSITPENISAVVLLGRSLLHRGRVGEAREHAQWALRLAPSDENALNFLTAIKARENWMLGLWWRFQCYINAGGVKRTILILVGLYLTYRVLVIYLNDHDLQKAAIGINFAWLAFCVYTWFAPVIFSRMLLKELKKTELHPDF